MRRTLSDYRPLQKPDGRAVMEVQVSERRPMPRSASQSSRTKAPSYSLFPPREKPLPPLPVVVEKKKKRSASASARISPDKARPRADSASLASAYSLSASTASTASSAALRVGFERLLVSDSKRHGNSVYFLDPGATPRTVASKHGKDTVKIWRVDRGAVEGVVRFPAYTEA